MHKARRRINVARGADSDKEVGLGQRLINFIHAQRHFAEPHHVWAQRGRELATMAAVVHAKVFGPVKDLPGAGAAYFQQLTVHMQHP
ncbi:hypothetical protein D3C78_1818870 [compost metagenome]